jgi:dTDP-4-dehydrorhamnose reductase
MFKLLVTGSQGQVAQSLLRRAGAHRGMAVEAVGRPELDLERPETASAAIAARAPDAIVNAAAYTAVDKAEDELARAFAVNRDGAAAVAAAAQGLGIPLIHLSTDYVYDGEKRQPYVEGDATGPLGVYGRSKLEGEQAVLAACPGALILRTSWVYSPFGANFVKTMLRLGATRGHLWVVDDQTGNPTSALDLADAILRIAPSLAAEGGGLYHLAGTGHTTWCGLARHIFGFSARHGGPSPTVEAITTDQYPTAALRPGHSWLSCQAFEARFGFVLPAWQGSSAAVAAELLGGDLV